MPSHDLATVNGAGQLLAPAGTRRDALEVILRNSGPAPFETVFGPVSKTGQRGRDLEPIPNPLA